MTGIQELHQRRGGIDTNCAMPDCRNPAIGAFRIAHLQGQKGYIPPQNSPLEICNLAVFQFCSVHRITIDNYLRSMGFANKITEFGIDDINKWNAPPIHRRRL